MPCTTAAGSLSPLHEKRLLRFTTLDVLVVDGLRLRGLAQDEPADLYEIVQHRYEHGSTITTSNRAIDEWQPMFGNPLALAAMDRLLHHAHVLVIEGESYRDPPPTRRKKAQAAVAEAAR